MDYKTFIKKSLLQNDISSLKKYDKLTRNLVNNKKLNKRYLLINNKGLFKQYGGMEQPIHNVRVTHGNTTNNYKVGKYSPNNGLKYVVNGNNTNSFAVVKIEEIMKGHKTNQPKSNINKIQKVFENIVVEWLAEHTEHTKQIAIDKIKEMSLEEKKKFSTYVDDLISKLDRSMKVTQQGKHLDFTHQDEMMDLFVFINSLM